MTYLHCRIRIPIPVRTANQMQGSHSDWEGIFQSGKSRGILNRLEKLGKIKQNTGKLGAFQTNVICYYRPQVWGKVIFSQVFVCPGGRGSASKGEWGDPPPPELKKRAVRILLECFLLLNI